MKLPVLVSVPHGGTDVPPEIAARVAITPKDLFDDGDAFTREIYDLRGRVASIARADIARAFVDLNRSPDDLPPANPDGVVKTATCYARPIYARGHELDAEATQLLLARYHRPYHDRLAEAASNPAVRLALDCHSMANTAPDVAPDSGRERPLFCLSNDSGRTAPDALLVTLAKALADAFGCDEEDIGLNRPFKGGYITQQHGSGNLPWIQVEMNRSLYLATPWFDPETRTCASERLATLRDRFLTAVTAVAARLPA